jgi:hypothetical protein
MATLISVNVSFAPEPASNVNDSIIYSSNSFPVAISFASAEGGSQIIITNIVEKLTRKLNSGFQDS